MNTRADGLSYCQTAESINANLTGCGSSGTKGLCGVPSGGLKFLKKDKITIANDTSHDRCRQARRRARVGPRSPHGEPKAVRIMEYPARNTNPSNPDLIVPVTLVTAHDSAS